MTLSVSDDLIVHSLIYITELSSSNKRMEINRKINKTGMKPLKIRIRTS